MAKLAADLVHFGHDYRIQYERDAADSEKARLRYVLPPPHELLVFVGVAVASGVIGNAGYDSIKLAVRRIHSAFLKQGRLPPDMDVLDDELLGRLDQHFRNFLGGMQDMPAAVRSAVVEEMVVDAMTKYLMEHPKEAMRLKKAKNSATRAGIHRQIMEKLERAEGATAKAGPDDFDDLWQNIDRLT
ncbi:MAG TPA: hypothetical protein VIP11_10920 [Gemmatimonadaceae bacterium]